MVVENPHTGHRVGSKDKQQIPNYEVEEAFRECRVAQYYLLWPLTVEVRNHDSIVAVLIKSQ